MVKIPDLFELLGAQKPKPSPLQMSRELEAFIKGQGRQNGNFDIGPYSAYLRRSVPRTIQGQEGNIELLRPLDIGETHLKSGAGSHHEEPSKENRAGAGQFREMINLLTEQARLNGYDSVYLENIINEFLPRVYGDMGFSEAGRDLAGTLSMYKRLR